MLGQDGRTPGVCAGLGQPWGWFALGWGRDGSLCIPQISGLEQSWVFAAWCCSVGDFGERGPRSGAIRVVLDDEMMKYFLANQRVQGLQSHAGGGWWLLGTHRGEGGCLVGSGLLLDAPLSGGAGGTGALPAQEAAPAAPPTAFQNLTALENNTCTPSSPWASAPGAQVSFSQLGRQSSALPWLNPSPLSPCRAENHHLPSCHLFILLDSDLLKHLPMDEGTQSRRTEPGRLHGEWKIVFWGFLEF